VSVPPDLRAAVDAYVTEALGLEDEVLAGVLRANAEAGLPAIDVSAPQGALLGLLARAIGAKAVLEVGTLGGYSTICLGRALPPGGRVVSLEIDPHRAEVARRNVASARLDGVTVDVRVGPALETLRDVEGPFDLVFVDADKAATPDYVAAALGLVRAGGLIVADNVVRRGTLADADSDDPAVRGGRRLHDLLAAEPRVVATTIQTVGAKSYDGFTIALVTG
jgi:predicted O-methyltransferase YrrM